MSRPQLTQLRKKLHRHPEISGQEKETSGLLASELEQISTDGIITGLGGTGIAIRFMGKKEGPRLMFRCELDALPIKEVNDFDHKSEVEGVSHKCGHDGHMVIMYGFARKLARSRPKRGEVVLLFQPAEENGKGALSVLEDERFSDIRPDYIFALHNLPGFRKSSIIWKEGIFSAAVKSLILRLHGKTSHAGEPDKGKNPARAIAQIINRSLKFNKPDSSSEDFAVVTVIHVVLGEKAYGISAGEGEVHLTFRTWTSPKTDDLGDELLHAAKNICHKHGLQLDWEWTQEFQANQNDPEAVKYIKAAAEKLDLDMEHIENPFSWGEDFGLFTEKFSGAMFGLGAGLDTPALHNPDYDFPDEITETGIDMFQAIANGILNEE